MLLFIQDVLERVKIQIEDGNVGVNFAEGGELLVGIFVIFVCSVMLVSQAICVLIHEFMCACSRVVDTRLNQCVQ